MPFQDAMLSPGTTYKHTHASLPWQRKSFPGELWLLGLIQDGFKREKEADKAADGE